MIQKILLQTFLFLLFFTAGASLLEATDSFHARDFYLKPLAGDFVIGAKNAPIIIIEYSTFSCSHCAHFHQKVFNDVKKNFIDTNKVQWVSRPFVADAPSMKGALLTTCGTNERYFLLSNILFLKQSAWVYNHNFEDVLKNIAILSGMNESEFQKCMNDKKKQEFLTNQRIVAKQVLEIKGTPVFFVNGIQEPLYSYQDFENKINSILKTK